LVFISILHFPLAAFFSFGSFTLFLFGFWGFQLLHKSEKSDEKMVSEKVSEKERSGSVGRIEKKEA